MKKQSTAVAKSSAKAKPNLRSVSTGTSSIQYVATNCHHCGSGAKSIKREFSPHALRALISWGEFRRENVDQPICEGCYKDIRDVLIERSDEILQSPLTVLASAVANNSRARRNC